MTRQSGKTCLARRRCDVILAMLRDEQPYLTPDQRADLAESDLEVPEAA